MAQSLLISSASTVKTSLTNKVSRHGKPPMTETYITLHKENDAKKVMAEMKMKKVVRIDLSIQK